MCFLHKELQSIMMKHIPESYRLYVMFLVCARLDDFSLTGSREVCLFFLSLCVECSFLLFFFFFLNDTDVQRVLSQNQNPGFEALLSRSDLGKCDRVSFPGIPGAEPITTES